MRHRHADELLSGAVAALAAEGSLRERVCAAWNGHLTVLRPDELPSDLQPEFSAMKDTATEAGSYEETVGSMTDDQVRSLRDRILSLHRSLLLSEK